MWIHVAFKKNVRTVFPGKRDGNHKALPGTWRLINPISRCYWSSNLITKVVSRIIQGVQVDVIDHLPLYGIKELLVLFIWLPEIETRRRFEHVQCETRCETCGSANSCSAQSITLGWGEEICICIGWLVYKAKPLARFVWLFLGWLFPKPEQTLARSGCFIETVCWIFIGRLFPMWVVGHYIPPFHCAMCFFFANSPCLATLWHWKACAEVPELDTD